MHTHTHTHTHQGCIQDSGLGGGGGGGGQIELPNLRGGNAIWERIGVQRPGGGGRWVGIIGSNDMWGGGGGGGGVLLHNR